MRRIIYFRGSLITGIVCVCSWMASCQISLQQQREPVHVPISNQPKNTIQETSSQVPTSTSIPANPQPEPPITASDSTGENYYLATLASGGVNQKSNPPRHKKLQTKLQSDVDDLLDEDPLIAYSREPEKSHEPGKNSQKTPKERRNSEIDTKNLAVDVFLRELDSEESLVSRPYDVKSPTIMSHRENRSLETATFDLNAEEFDTTVEQTRPPAQEVVSFNSRAIKNIELSVPKPLPNKQIADDDDEIFASGVDLIPANRTIEDIPIVMNPRVERALAFYLARPDVVKAGLRRSGRYLKMFRKILSDEGLPLNLAYLAGVESNYYSKAHSPASALGLWQFIESTGRLYGLKKNQWIDERMDPIKSTRAAAQYLKRLYRMFGSWDLALAAYNAGEGRVGRAIRQSEKEGNSTDYWSLDLPRETRNYVPAFMALVMISQSPKRYGFEEIEMMPPMNETTLRISTAYSLQEIAQRAKLPLNDLLDENPFLIKGIPPLNTQEYDLYLPAAVQPILLESLASNPTPSTSWGSYTPYVDSSSQTTRLLEDYGQEIFVPVLAGDTLQTLAKRHHTSVERLKQWNQLKGRGLLRTNKELRIYAPTQSVFARLGNKAHRNQTTTSRTEVVKSDSNRVNVSKGTDLAAIAKKHKVSVKQLLSWNNLKNAKQLKPGQKLIVKKTTKNTQKIVTVKAGDTLWTIAKTYGISVERLISINDLKSAKAIHLNQKLIIPTASNSDES